MAAPSLVLLVLAPSLLSLGQPVSGESDLLVTGNYAVISDEPLSNAEAAAASVDFIMAEAAAAAAEDAPADIEVWDTDDDDEDGEDNEVTAVGVGGMSPPFIPPQPFIPDPLNALFDFALGVVVHDLVASHSAEQPVPDFHKEFKARIGFIRVHGHIEAQGGTAGDLSSLFRDGSATLRKEPSGILVLQAAAGLRHLRLRYRHYSARAGPIRVSGTLEAETSPATLRAEVALVPPCGAQLRSLSVAHVGPLRVHASGLGALRVLMPLLQRWMDKRVKGDVERMVLQRLSQIVTSELKRVSCK